LEFVGGAIILVVLLVQPTIGSFSVIEDPRAGGLVWEPGAGTAGSATRDLSEVNPGGSSGDVAKPGEGHGSALPDGSGAAQPPAGGGEGDGSGQGEGDGEGDGGEPSEGGPVVYVVRAGDTLSGISSRYGVSVSDLWIANRLRNPHSLMPGQSLVIPSSPDEVLGTAPGGQDGAGQGPATGTQVSAEPVYHRVRSGENLWVIARSYGTTVAALCETNGIAVNAVLHPGQRLEVPRDASRAPTPPSVVLDNWPLYGTITSPFGMRSGKMHAGLDIAAPRGTPILAAAAGTIKSAGVMGNYGRALIIDHGNGLSTLYAHCDRLLVSRGQRVVAGQKVALVGSTGKSTGPHLHFEVIINGRRRDPLDYLWGG
jgi:murein DD-endopeptidase MepM/ murein hydrolase activator NlpD